MSNPDTSLIRLICAQIDKARALQKISAIEKHRGGDEKSPKIGMVEVDASIGSGISASNLEDAERLASILKAIWIDPIREVEMRAVVALRDAVCANAEDTPNDRE